MKLYIFTPINDVLNISSQELMAGHSAGTNPIKSHIAHRNDIEGKCKL